MRRLAMPETVRGEYRAERSSAKVAARLRDDAKAWQHLERAHVLAQPFPLAHVGSHVTMLVLGVRCHDWREVTGQLVRVLVAGPASARGRFPAGNTGRARLPLRAELPVPADLAGILEEVAR